jgi:hypothetical protein
MRPRSSPLPADAPDVTHLCLAFPLKSALSAAESSSFAVESGDQIANAPKSLCPAVTYAQRTPWRMMLQK